MALLRAAFLAMCLVTAPVWASTDYSNDPFDAAIAREAWNLIGEAEKKNGIPTGLLHAMSLTETGQGVAGWMMPWPYTVCVNSTGLKSYVKVQHALNDLAWFKKMGFVRFDVKAGGKSLTGARYEAASNLLNAQAAGTSFSIKPQPFGRRFANAQEARTFVYKMFAFGHKNLDLGLMQVNWKFHGQHFGSVDRAFDVHANINYAASYLMEHRQTRDWWGSVGRYHSGTPFYAKRYVKNVWGWYKRVHDYNNGRQIALR